MTAPEKCDKTKAAGDITQLLALASCLLIFPPLIFMKKNDFRLEKLTYSKKYLCFYDKNPAL